MSRVLALALVLTACSATNVDACGRYGAFLPIDGVVQSALSPDGRTATKACLELHRLGEEGLRRVDDAILGERIRLDRARSGRDVLRGRAGSMALDSFDHECKLRAATVRTHERNIEALRAIRELLVKLRKPPVVVG